MCRRHRSHMFERVARPEDDHGDPAHRGAAKNFVTASGGIVTVEQTYSRPGSANGLLGILGRPREHDTISQCFDQRPEQGGGDCVVGEDQNHRRHCRELPQRPNQRGLTRTKSSETLPGMMAFERTPSRSSLEHETVEALRATLARSVAQGNHVAELRDVLCKTASDARSKGIQAEQLLVILKEIWFGLPDVVNASSSDAENVLLQELISRCIQEYYSL